MKLPQLPRSPLRPELASDIEKEIWQPDWNCFCCHDTGLVTGSAIFAVIPDYDGLRDQPVACRHPRCEAGTYYQGDETYDDRFTQALCINLDKWERQGWKETIENRFKNAQENAQKAAEGILTLANSLAMPGTRPRTGNETREIEIRKQNIEVIENEEVMV